MFPCLRFEARHLCSDSNTQLVTETKHAETGQLHWVIRQSKSNKWPIHFHQNTRRYIPERTVNVATNDHNILHRNFFEGASSTGCRHIRYVINNPREYNIP
jgi:hypothetical protein